MGVYKGDIYYGAGKTNCLTYVPKNINLTLTDGILTLKAGSKVYIPNGFETKEITTEEVYECFLGANNSYYYAKVPYAEGDYSYTRSDGGLASSSEDLWEDLGEISAINSDGSIDIKYSKEEAFSCTRYTDGDLREVKTEIITTDIPKFDEKVIESDLSLVRNFTETGMLFLGEGGGHITACQQFSSGSSPSISVQYGVWYDTSNNLIKYTVDTGNTWISGFSFPLCTYTANATSGFTSINQTFDWVGYIGSSVFVLPGVKGLISNEFNPNGTYKNIEFEIDKVLINTRPWSTKWSINQHGLDAVYYKNYAEQATQPTFTNGIWLNTKENVIYKISNSAIEGVVQNVYAFDMVAQDTTEPYSITSITPRAVQTNNTTRKIGDVYFCPGKTNCLTSFPKNVDWSLSNGQVTLKAGSKVYIPNGWDIGQVGIYGSPTIADGVVNGFSASNYLTFSDNFRPDTNTWEMLFKVTTGSELSGSEEFVVAISNGFTHETRYGTRISISNGKFNFSVTYDGTAWDIPVETATGVYDVQVNTTYYIKFEYTGSAYKLYYSLNGIDFIEDINIASSTPIYNSCTACLIGIWNNGSFVKPFLGSIDLSESYIKINDEIWWQGKKGNGKRVFDEVVIDGDKTFNNTGGTGIYPMFYDKYNNSIHSAVPTMGSGTATPTASTSYQLFYNVSENIIYFDGGSQLGGYSLPLGRINATDGVPTSISQHFSWFGFIGSTAFTLPNIEGLCSNGFNTDGTYKNVRGYEDEVQIHTYTSNWTRAKQPIFLQNGRIDFTNVNNDGYHEGTDRSAYDSLSYQCFYNTKENKTYYSGSTAGSWSQTYRTLLGYINMTSGVISSITHIGAKTTNDLKRVKETYNGSTLVRGYISNATIFEKSTAGTYTVTIPYNGYYQLWLVGAGGGGMFNSSGNKGSSAAGNSGGYVNVKAYLKKGSYSVTVGAGGAAKGGLDWTGWGNNGGNTSITFDGKTLLLAGGGTANKVSYPSGYQQNSTISVVNQINSGNFTLVQTVSNLAGNKGGLGGNGSSPTGGASRYGGYGKGGNVYNRNRADAGGNGYVKVVAI